MRPDRRHRARRIAILLLPMLLLACQGGPPPQRFKVRDATWDAFRARLGHALGPAFELEKRRAAAGIPVRLRVGGADLSDDREHVQAHAACGELVEVFVRRLPPPAASRIGPDEALELDPAGEVVGRWPLPPDTPIVAVRGDDLLTPYRVALDDGRTLNVLLAVRSDGELRVEAWRSAPPPLGIACPASGELLETLLPIRRCQAFDDAGRVRVFAYEGACIAPAGA